MHLKIKLLATVALLTTVAFVSCKKSGVDTPSTDNTTELSVQTDDQSRFSTEIDGIANDANLVIESNASFNGKVENVLGTLCNAAFTVDSLSATKKITITYSGLSCWGNNSLTGVVVLSMPKATHWKDAGAVLTIDIQNLKVTRVRDNKSITINGTKTITNVTGGRLTDLATRGTITHAIASAGLSVTFDNGTQRTWQVAKQRVFTYNNGIVITTTGTHTEAGVSGIAEWGTNRFGNAFTAAITKPMVIRQDCDFRLVSGEVTHGKLAAGIVVATFGLNAAGEPTTCPGTTGTYYFKLVWTGIGGQVRSVILPY